MSPLFTKNDEEYSQTVTALKIVNRSKAGTMLRVLTTWRSR